MLEHINIFFLAKVEAVALLVLVYDFVYDNRALKTCVASNLSNRFFDSLNNNVDTCFKVSIVCIKEFFNLGDSVQKSNAAACYAALFNSCFCSCKSVLDTKLLFFHFGFGSGTYTDNSYAACKLCKSFLKLLTIKFRGCVLNLTLDLCNSALDAVFVACTVNDSGGFLCNLNLLSPTEHRNICVLKLKTEV